MYCNDFRLTLTIQHLAGASRLLGMNLRQSDPPSTVFSVSNHFEGPAKKQMWACRSFLVAGALSIAATAIADSAAAQGTRQAQPTPAEATEARAAERTGTIDIDGRLDEAAWAAAPISTGFVQREPVEGTPAEQPTEVRILYDGVAVYVGARMFDSEPGKIATQLVRRDEWGQYDYFEVGFDPNQDRRTGYVFRVSAANVQRDVYLFGDSDDDEAWNAVWASAVTIDSLGWSAELRIPLSQMRYEASDESQTWGVNFVRRRVSSNEETHFALISRTQSGVVSQFGTLEDMLIPRASRLLEFLPYALSSAYTAPAIPGDPFFDGTDVTGRVGLDLRYGLGAQFTLYSTINPDFGQVEADPAVINLTAFEVRFDERRPFFVEDAQVFDFSLSAGQDLYYSRRIGRGPHGRPPSGAQFVDMPDRATILGAAKVTGRTTGGLSLGTLAALTRAETGRATFDGSTVPESFTVEPTSAYGVVRLQQDFNNGSSAIGGIATFTGRDLPSEGTFDFLPETAVSLGVDFEFQWDDRTWALYGYASAAQVRGDSTAMIRIQRSSNHFRQRPDSRWVEFDSSATSLTGVDWRLTFAKRRGQHWTGSLWVAETTPGFEINDLGFSRRQEALDGGARIEYQEIRPGNVFRSYSTRFSTFHNFSHDALADPGAWESWQRAHVSGSFNLDAEFELLNYWEFEGGFTFGPQRMDRTATRGGPLMMSPKSYSVDVGFQTDRRSRFNIGPSIDYEWAELDARKQLGVGLDMEFRPTSTIELEVEPQFSLSQDAAQYVTTSNALYHAPTYGNRYIFGELDRKELSLETRLNVVLTPKLSVQLFAQPLLSSGTYLSYRQLEQSETFDFDVFEEGTHTVANGLDTCVNGRICLDPSGLQHVDFDGDGTVDDSFADRD